MANQNVFCAVPWHNTHLYWDGSYGACCSESHKPVNNQSENIKDLSLQQWYTGDTMKNFRQRILGDQPLSECSSCYYEESFGYQSRRIRENYKVGIFTKQAFRKSFAQSKWYPIFNNDVTKLPIDWHIDFGNECNLACKMCSPLASSQIANQYVKWHIDFQKSDSWVNNNESWQQFLNNIEQTKKLHRIHVMGGEPTINKKFLQFVNWLIEKKLTDIELSFVTNGTKLDFNLIANLKKFKNVDIEISVESTENNNSYIRQGSDTNLVWQNIETYCQLRSPTLSVVLRSVPQLLSVNTYHKYILRAYNLGLSIQSIPLRQPSYMAIPIIPYAIRQQFRDNFTSLKETIKKDNITNLKTISLGRDTSRLAEQLTIECDTIVNFLDSDPSSNVEAQRLELVSWLVRWDKIYNLNAMQIYPEYATFFEEYGYSF